MTKSQTTALAAVALGEVKPRPLLKWAGGKSQLLTELERFIPKKFGTFIEPFCGGGALFFHLQPAKAVVADSNPELVNLYRCVATNPKKVHAELLKLPLGKSAYYEIRTWTRKELSDCVAAARTIYLNRSGFNGLYRVNRKGQFNVPFGNHLNPRFPSIEHFSAVSSSLKKANIVLGDYKDVLQEFASAGDFVFVDPPYLPVGKYSDFKRYTAEQFHEDDHRDLAEEVGRLTDIGCHVILTSSVHPLVYELYRKFEITIVNTRRNINSNGASRKGQDVIVSAKSTRSRSLRSVPPALPEQMREYPTTRFMGSKSKILGDIHGVVSQLEFETAIDAFSGSGIVSYLFKSMGKRVITNDYMAMSWNLATALVENNTVTLSDAQIERMLEKAPQSDQFVSKTFKDLYFSNSDNAIIDDIRFNIGRLRNSYARAIAMAALIRACTKRRPRGIFTYVGDRYDDGRADLQKSIAEHFIIAIKQINDAVFDNCKENSALNSDALSLRTRKNSLVYLDPPYFSPRSDNEYVRRYHFLEGLARNWEGVEIQEHTQTKKFKSYPTPFSTHAGAVGAFETLFRRFNKSIIVVSYASNALPSVDELAELLGKFKQRVEVVPIDHRYSFGNQGHRVGDNRNEVKEYLFVGN